MAKKSRKARARSRVSETTRQPAATPAQQKAQPASVKAKTQPNAAAVAVQPQNYNYVKTDLVHIAVIAGALFLILMILTFVPALK